ncbi:lantibiotic dehydratase [Kitasatospora sp. NPDC058190]|uniref:lantibiotic dehydratase n=1 Tax=Kitasatospora sp. NPDC058190 TaxID=3346371 RepID=UPI0036D923BB
MGAGPGSLYEPAPWLIVRTPLLPAAGPELTSPPNSRDSLADPRALRALAIASPDLLEALQRPEANARDTARAELKLVRYLIRMRTRPTPYGACAAVSLAAWGEHTTLSVRNDRDRIRTRPDMGWLTELCLALDNDSATRTESRWTVNPLAVEHHGRLRLADGRADGLGSVRLTAAVREVLRAARHPVPYPRLHQHLLDHTSGSPEQVDRLLAELWEQHLLVTDLRARLTTADPADDLCRRLAARPSCARTAEKLAGLLAEMSGFDSAPPAEAPARGRSITQRARGIHPVTGPVFQTDMARPLGGDQVSASVGEACAQAAELLLRMSPRPLGSPDLSAYRSAFIARYGQDREVPVLEVLDEHTGIGPLGHEHASRRSGVPESDARRARVLTDLALGALRDREHVVELTDTALEELQTWNPTPVLAPVSLELSAFVAATSAEAVDRGDFLVVVGPNLGANSAGRSLGRFADLLAPRGTEALRSLAEAEYRARPDAGTQAEVVYLPVSHRMANVVVRPASCDHEIVLDVPAGVPARQTVLLDDILVSVRDNRFHLRSGSLDIALRPTARHMLNVRQAPAVCRFLDEVSRDGSPEFTPFDWGPAAAFPFLPRVQYGRIVLSPARWLLRSAVDGSDGWTADDTAFAGHVTTWRAAWSVPPRLYLTMADNRLLLDLDDPRQIEQLRAEARSGRAEQLVFQEALPDTTAAWIPGAGGLFMSEIVVPLVLHPTPTSPEPARTAALARRTRRGNGRPASIRDRTRLPGGNWLFAKLYCDPDQENFLLTGPLTQLCEMAEVSGLAEQWFFIRYADPDPHLRVRWKGNPDVLTRYLLPEVTRFTSRLADEGLVSRLVIDTYERELERYGGTEGTDTSEEVFCADSRAVMRLLAHHTDAARPSDDLAELIVVTIDDLLAGLGLGAEDRGHWYSDQVRQHPAEARHQAGDDYRARQKRLRALLGSPQGPALLGDAVVEILRQRRSELARAGARLAELEAAGRLSVPRNRLLASYVHLHCNRLLTGGYPTEERLLQILQRTRKGLGVEPVTSGTRDQRSP